MDIICPNCGEPWDTSEVAEVAEVTDSTPTAVFRRFKREGCRALDGECVYTLHEDQRAMLREVYALAGDDIDGAACDLEDLAGVMFA